MSWDRHERTYSRQHPSGPNKLVFFAVVAAIAGGIFLWNIPRNSASTISYDVLSRHPALEPVAHRLTEEPCNRTLALEMSRELITTAENAAALAFIQASEKKCGANEELRPLMLVAQINSSDLTGANKTAEQLVAANPADPQVYGWRAQIREKLGDVAGAYLDQQKALNLFPDPSTVAAQVYYDLARLADSLAQPCEAADIMRDYLAFDPAARRTAQVSTLLREWQSKGACPSPFGSGTAQLRYDPKLPVIVLPVEVNGVAARMVIDTGATRTVLTKSLAERAKIRPTEDMGATVRTAGGELWHTGGRADTISLEGAVTHNVPVFIQESDKHLGDGIDGLLGLSFLGNFELHMKDGVLELAPLK